MKKGALLFLALLFWGGMQLFASDANATKTSRIEIVITLAGVQETVASIEKSTQQIAALTQQLSDKNDFSADDAAVIRSLTNALNNNAEAVNNIAQALPEQMEKAQGGLNAILDTAMINTQKVVSSSKSDLIDPTLSRIENRLLILVLIIAAVLFGLLWFGLWKLRAIVSTGSETIANITQTVKSLETVLEKVNKGGEAAK